MEGKAMQRALAVAVLVLAVGGVIAWRASRPPRHEVTMTFKDAQGLKRGHKVTYKSVPVGEVTEVALSPAGQVETRLWLYDQDKALIHEGATGYITQNSLVSVSGEKSVELVNAAETGSPVGAGTQLAGVEGKMELMGWKAARMAESVTSGAKAKASEWYERATSRMNEMYASAKKSLQGEEQEPDTKRFLEDLKAAADRGMKDFEAEWPNLQERYRELYGKLKERSGPAAERLRKAWEEFEAGMEQEMSK